VTAESAGRQLLPVACTLGPADGGQRLADWRHVTEVAGAGRDIATGKVTLRFHDLPGIASELERLVAGERECCAFLGWQLVHAGNEWHVDITGTDENLQALPLSE
jgi:hypothetical protein